MDDKLTLTDFIGRKTLQKMQDAFSNMTGVAAITTDADGMAVTDGSGFSEFCQYTRSTKEGCRRCAECDKRGGELAFEKGSSVVYNCHTGLLVFAAPIMADNRLLGSFICGQVLTEEPDLARIREIASEIGVDEDAYVAAVGKIVRTERDRIEHMARFLYTMTDVLSDMAYHKNLAHVAKREQ